ncbi:MAG: patched family protein, partial [Dyadobacter sp.]
MWNKLATYIIRYRLWWVALVLVSTVFMAYEAKKIELSYQFARILPANDPVEKEYQDFRKLFGEDGSVMVIGWQDPGLFQVNKFQDWCKLSQRIKETTGIKNVLSLANLQKVVRNDSLSQFDFAPIIRTIPTTQTEVDSLKKEILNLPFYEGLVLNSKTNATLIVITFNDKALNSARRLSIVGDIEAMAEEFAVKYKTDL